MPRKIAAQVTHMTLSTLASEMEEKNRLTTHSRLMP